jgi:hypothetical protein
MPFADVITMTMRELDRSKVIQMVADGMLKPWRAALRLELTTRQVRRLVARLREDGPAGLISKRYSQPSNHRLDPGIAVEALSIIRERYADFGPTLACEKLRERHGLRLAKETVRRLMMASDLWIPRRQRPPKIHQLRHRRACFGELIQIDGSDHRWFEDRAPACTLLVFIDDATSRLMALHFTATESTFSYFEALHKYLIAHGKPLALYSDKAAVFRSTRAEVTAGKGVTQFARACYELNIDTFCANSSQAKGRVERANLTLQDRLVKELRLQGIDTRDAANAYAPSFTDDYNRRFGKEPQSDFNAHRVVRPDEDLHLTMTHRASRCVSNNLTVQYDKVRYMLEDLPETRALIHHYIDVYEYPDGAIEVRANGAALAYKCYDRLGEMDQGEVVEHKRLGHVLQVARAVQEQRDNRRATDSPSRTHRGEPVQPKIRPTGKIKQRELTQEMLNQIIMKTSENWAASPPEANKKRKVKT